MAKSELDLLENAIDSLNEALRKYEEGSDGNTKAFKFSILHFAHFIELVLKYYVSQAHHLLIYRKPFSKNLNKENTIGLWEALQFVKNEGHHISKEFEEDLKWLKTLRNDIEHHRFSLDIHQAKKTLGRLMQTINELNAAIGGFDLKAHIGQDLLNTFETLADEYKAQIANAIAEADEIGGTENGYFCSSCGHAGTLSLSSGVYKCHFCEEECEEVDCSICGNSIPENEGIVWNEDHPPDIDYICDGCADRFDEI